MNVCRSWWDDGRSEGSFSGIGRHGAPGDAVVVAGGGAVPVGAEAVVGGAIASRFVLSDGFSTCRKCLQVGCDPVLVVSHGLIGLLVQRRGDVEMGALKNYVVPGG